MISLEDVEKAIEEHEQMEASFQTCERLAWLYIVRENLRKKIDADEDDSLASKCDIDAAKSEFGKLIRTKNTERVMAVIDELMQTIQVVNPRLYAGTIQRIKDL